MSISAVRSILYLIARLLGDVSAVQRGRVGQRLARRAAGKVVGRIFRVIFK